MMETINKDKKHAQIDFKGIWSSFVAHKLLFVKVFAATFIIACILTLSLPNYYGASVILAPENDGISSRGGGLSSLASSFGVSLGGMSSGEDAIGPSLYPDMMNSIDFKTSLFSIKIHKLYSEDIYTYYEYLRDYQKVPWWTAGIDAIFSLFKSKENGDITIVNPFMLTKEQSTIIKIMRDKIGCDVDNKTNVISISVIDQDPLVAATMADSVKQRLQEFITAYRTSKARVDLEYNKKLYEETKFKYDLARQEYAVYADANTDIILQRDRNKLLELENEMQLRYQAYSTVSAQLQAAEAKVQEDTPAFTTIQNATVPLLKAGPSRSRIVLLYCFFTFLFTCAYVLYKEGHLKQIAFGVEGEEYDPQKL